MVDENTPLVPKDALQVRKLEEASQLYTSTKDDGANSPQVDVEKSTPAPSIALASVIIPMSIGIFLVAMDKSIVLATFAAIGSELNQLRNTSWIFTGYMLTLTCFQPLYGKMSDIFGRKACLLFAYSAFALGCLFCGLARNMNELILARAFAGIGGGGMSTMVSTTVSDIVPLRSRGTWQGLLNILSAVGTAAGAPLGGFLTDRIGWRWVFLIQFPATLIAILAVSVALHLPNKPVLDFKAGLKRVDFKGAISLILATVCLLFGLDRGGNTSWHDPLTIYSLASSFVLYLVFAAIEFKFASEPFAPKRILINRSLFAGYLVNFFGMLSSISMLFHLSLYLQAVEGKSPSQAGLWLLPCIVGGVTGSLGGGLLLQKTGKYYFLTVSGYIIFLVGITIITLTTGVAVRSFIGMSFGLLMAQLGSGCGVTSSLVSLIANARPEDRAIATAVSYLFRSLGTVVGVSIGSALLQDSLGKYLRSRLTGQDVDEVIRRVRESISYIKELDFPTRTIVVRSYDEAAHITMWFTVIIAGCAVVAAICIKEQSLSR